MLILHALLFSGLFSTAPVLLLYKHHDSQKLEFPKSSSPLDLDIPREAYGRWYRLYGPNRPVSEILLKQIYIYLTRVTQTISAVFKDDVMLIDDPTMIHPPRLLSEPGRLYSEGTLQNHELGRFVGHWIRYPTVRGLCNLTIFHVSQISSNFTARGLRGVS